MNATAPAPQRRTDRLQVLARVLAMLGLAVYCGLVFASVLGAGAAVSGEFPHRGFSFVATAIVAVSLPRAREAVGRLAGRLVYGERATPDEVLAQFADRVSGAVGPIEAPARMASLLRRGTGATSATVWVRVGDTMIPAASSPPEARPARSIVVTDEAAVLPPRGAAEIRHQGELLGAVTLGGAEHLTPLQSRLLDDVAAAAGIVLRNVGLTAELTARLDQISNQAAELRTSRRRIVAAAGAERRRIERDIHDGAQQHLVALAVKARVARNLVAGNPPAAAPAVAELRRLGERALDTLTGLVNGIYPPVLRARGIAPALREHVRLTGLPARVTAASVGRHPPAVEAAVYFSCLEAMQNGAAHAGATRIEVRLGIEAGALTFEVADDGRGFDPERTSRGTGLTSMADRIEALGGTLSVDSATGEGTTVRGALPL